MEGVFPPSPAVTVPYSPQFGNETTSLIITNQFFSVTEFFFFFGIVVHITEKLVIPEYSLSFKQHLTHRLLHVVFR